MTGLQGVCRKQPINDSLIDVSISLSEINKSIFLNGGIYKMVDMLVYLRMGKLREIGTDNGGNRKPCLWTDKRSPGSTWRSPWIGAQTVYL